MQRYLRSFGPIGGLFANLLTFLTANWALAVSAVTAVIAVLWKTSFDFVNRSEVQTATLLFLVMLWSYIGITVLRDRKKPRETRPFHDYKYGLTFEGIIPYFNLKATGNEAAMAFAIQLRNFSSGPLKYEFEVFEIIINNRTLPRLAKGVLTSIMPRGAGRISRNQGFKKEDITGFVGKTVKGTLELVIVYGHPEKPPERRLRMTFDLNLALKAKGPSGYSDTITSESDVAI